MKNKYTNIMNCLIAMSQEDNKNLKAFIESKNIEDHFEEQSLFFYNVHKSRDGERYEIPEWMQKKRNELKKLIEEGKGLISVMAPTSFGKSHAIIEAILNTKDKSIVISPTLSLCSEYFLNIKYKKDKYINKKEKYIDKDFKHVVTTTPLAIESTIFILTPEKASLLLKLEPNIEFKYAIFDEFYEAFTGDRSQIFGQVFNEIKKKSEKQIIITPSIAKFPDKYTSSEEQNFSASETLTKRKFTKYILSKKNNMTFKYLSSEFGSSEANGFLKDEIKGKVEIIDVIKEYVVEKKKNAIILLMSKSKMVDFCDGLIKVNDIEDIDISKTKVIPLIIEYLEANFSECVLIKMLKKGIAYHNGSVDRFVRTLIEVAFKKNEINLLVANTTITKGVNLNPSTLMIDNYNYISRNGSSAEQKKIEFLNSIGRTGRTIKKRDLIGHVVIFTTENSIFKNYEQITKNNNNEKIILNEYTPKEVEKIASYKEAYRNNLIEKKEISWGDKQIKLLNDFLNKDIDENNEEKKYLVKCENIFNLVNNVFDIKFDENMKYAMWILIRSFLLSEGFSKYGKKRRDYVIQEKYYIKNNGVISSEERTGFQKFEKFTIHEDFLMMGAYNDYETTAGFYFNYLLNSIIDSAIEKRYINKDIYKRYIEKLEESEKIAFEKGYPNSFAGVKMKNDQDAFLKKALNAITE